MWFATLLTLLPFAYGSSSSNCSKVGFIAPSQKALHHVRTAFLNFSHQHGYGYPIGIGYARDGDAAFVALSRNGSLAHPTSMLVLNTSKLAPVVIQNIPLSAYYPGSSGVAGITLSADGKLLYSAAAAGALVIDTDRAIRKLAHPIVGILDGTTKKQYPGTTAFSAALSLDGKYLFVLDEYGGPFSPPYIGDVDVFHLHAPTADGTVEGKAVGYVETGQATTAGVLSPNGSHFYVVNEIALGGNQMARGSIITLDVPTLEAAPNKSIIGNLTVGCGSVRDAMSHKGDYLWVANRGSNNVQAYDTAKVRWDPNSALITSVDVGTAPISILFVQNETRLLVANSNRNNDTYSPGYNPIATAGIGVIDVAAALRNDSGAYLGQIPSGSFPRELALSNDGKTVLVSNFNSQSVMAIDLSTLP